VHPLCDARQTGIVYPAITFCDSVITNGSTGSLLPSAQLRPSSPPGSWPARRVRGGPATSLPGWACARYGSELRVGSTVSAKLYPLEASQLIDQVMAPPMAGQVDGGV
jgi:hypothetical protein